MASINPFGRISIYRALLIGFGLVWLVMALCVALAVARLEPVLDQIATVNASRVPTTNALGRLAGAVQESMSAANAYLVTLDAGFKKQRRGALADLDSQVAVLEGLEPTWDDKTRATWKETLPLLKELGAAQDLAEMTVYDASSAREGAALLKISAAPKSARILDLLYGVRPEKGPRQGGLLQQEQEGLNERLTDLGRTVRAIEQQLALGLLIASLLSALAVYLVTRATAKPLGELSTGMSAIAQGDLDTRIDYLDRPNEIGMIARALQVFRQSLLDARARTEAEAKARQARLERGERMEALIGQLDRDVSSALDHMADSAKHLAQTARAMSENAAQAQQQATNVSDISAHAARDLAQVAAETERLTASIAEISGQVGESRQIAAEAVSQAEATDGDVQSLAEAAAKIGDIVGLITDIANQTNLLALNATIEAARAGEAGRGFAVVASEVKTLAGQTGRATEEIGTQITAIQGATSRAVGAIQAIGQVIQRLSAISATIAGAIQQQGGATHMISGNVASAAQGSTAVATNIAGVRETARETGAAAAHVLQSAHEVTDQAEALRGRIASFLSSVRTL